VALSNRDAVAAVNVGPGAHGPQFSVKGYFDTGCPRRATLELSLKTGGEWGRKPALCCNSASDSVAVIDTAKLTTKVSKQGM